MKREKISKKSKFRKLLFLSAPIILTIVCLMLIAQVLYVKNARIIDKRVSDFEVDQLNFELTQVISDSISTDGFYHETWAFISSGSSDLIKVIVKNPLESDAEISYKLSTTSKNPLVNQILIKVNKNHISSGARLTDYISFSTTGDSENLPLTSTEIAYSLEILINGKHFGDGKIILHYQPLLVTDLKPTIFGSEFEVSGFSKRLEVKSANDWNELRQE